jgi:IclR family transcriptional regulator, acetate operon repressor
MNAAPRTKSPTALAQAAPPRGTRIQSVARSCQLLLWLAERRDGAMAKEAAFANQLALPTTYHLLNTLVDHGLLTKDARRRYTLGSGTGILAEAYLRGTSVPEALLTAVRKVAVRTGETTYLADWGEHDIRVLASVEGTSVVRVAEVAAGPYEDGYARANGKVLLAYGSPEAREAYLERHPLRRRTANTICDRRSLETELEHVRELGYAVDNEEFADGVSCIAAPILDRGAFIASLAISAPTSRFGEARDRALAIILEVIGEIEADDVAAEPALNL